MGVWIETITAHYTQIRPTVTPYVGVWIETSDITVKMPNHMSHPTWVCGLKLKNNKYDDDRDRSHPTWVCGLKPELL